MLRGLGFGGFAPNRTADRPFGDSRIWWPWTRSETSTVGPTNRQGEKMARLNGKSRSQRAWVRPRESVYPTTQWDRPASVRCNTDQRSLIRATLAGERLPPVRTYRRLRTNTYRFFVIDSYINIGTIRVHGRNVWATSGGRSAFRGTDTLSIVRVPTTHAHACTCIRVAKRASVRRKNVRPSPAHAVTKNARPTGRRGM